MAFEAVRAGVEQEVDTVLIDTAGRLHTKTGLMDELGKVKRVIEKQAVVDEVLLVIDATTGQNGLTQARIFAEVVDITGIVLTKLDGTAKGASSSPSSESSGCPSSWWVWGRARTTWRRSRRMSSSTLSWTQEADAIAQRMVPVSNRPAGLTAMASERGR